MVKILFVAPIDGNGGIVSWAANYRKHMSSEVSLISIGISRRRATKKKNNLFGIIFDGLLDMKDVVRDVKDKLSGDNEIRIIHLTTSGGFGTFRDFFIAGVAKRNNVKCIMHCHYGCIPQDVNSKGIKAWFLRKTMRRFEQVWVLDGYSLETLRNDIALREKVLLVPNFIECHEMTVSDPKQYKRVGFVGNLIPTKGILELTMAVKSCPDTYLDIIGPGKESVIDKIRQIAGEELGKRILLHGRVDNAKAIEMMKSIDIIALPTYYPSEAFPISILEAMSLSKLVLSCPRAAIPDMLTDLEGKPCGLLVAPQSTKEIEKAIMWSQANNKEADEMCRRANEKVYSAYRTEIVMKQCVDNYMRLL